jgi:pyridoxamine 5'-phosphate oxidase
MPELGPLPDPLPADPLPVVRSWLDAAEALGMRNPTAVALATRDERGDPAARFVLCRRFDEQRGYFVFFTDRSSAKGRHLEAHPRAALSFYWEPFERQLRVRGPVLPSPEDESDAYFATRPGGAQISATISQQSQPLGSRAELVEAQARLARELGVSLQDARPGAVPRPKRWGGYRVWAQEIELWAGLPNRLHDRALFTRELARERDGFRTGPWRAVRLQP